MITNMGLWFVVVLGLIGGFDVSLLSFWFGFEWWEYRFAEVMGAVGDGGYGCAVVVCGWVCVVGLWWLLVAGWGGYWLLGVVAVGFCYTNGGGGEWMWKCGADGIVRKRETEARGKIKNYWKIIKKQYLNEMVKKIEVLI